MNDSVSILYVEHNPELLEVMLRVIHKVEHWKGLGAADDDAAKTALENHEFDIVLLGTGLTTTQEAALTTYIKNEYNMPVIQHYGGGSGLLQSEILNALAQKQ